MFSKKILTTLIFLLIFMGVFMFFSPPREIKEVVMGDKTFFVEVARTRSELEKGLSLHAPLLDDQGMLFVFTGEDFYGFWMKDMLFPIDIVWIDSNLTVVHTEKNVLPEDYPKIFRPATKSLYVLEVGAGQVDYLNVKIGDIVKFIRK